MTKIVFPVALIIALGSLAGTQTPDDVSRGAAANESITSRVDKLFAQWDKTDSAGCALGVIKEGKIIYERGYGMADLEHNTPITPRSAFDIASMSKQFTGM